jgi:hypothetical protein
MSDEQNRCRSWSFSAEEFGDRFDRFDVGAEDFEGGEDWDGEEQVVDR